MSVWISAILGHGWPCVSKAIIDEIAEAASLQTAPSEYKRISESKSKRREFTNDGSVIFLLPGNFSVRLSRKVLELEDSQRWGRLLLYKTVRRRFLAACRRVARVTGAREALVLPEATELSDCLWEDLSYSEIKQRALREWGPPDIGVSQYFTEKELSQMPYDRVHYLVVSFDKNGGRH